MWFGDQNKMKSLLNKGKRKILDDVFSFELFK